MFKVGEIVRVRKDLVVGKKYGGFLFHGFMGHFIGKEVKITDLTKEKQYNCYNEEFDDYFFFTSEMLEPVSKAKEYTLIVTDKKVIILDKENKKRGISTCHEEDTFDFSIGVKLAWNRLHGIKEETPKPQLTPPEFDRCIVSDHGESYSWKSLVEEFGYFFDKEGNGVKENKEYKVLGSVIRDTSSEDNAKIYLIQDEECKTYVIGAKGIKPVEYKLYDCNGVELKEGDEVYNICLDNGFIDSHTVELRDGILYNTGFRNSHSSKNNKGKLNYNTTLAKWKVLKK